MPAQARQGTTWPTMLLSTVKTAALPLPAAGTGAGWSVKPSKVATEVLARHAHDHSRRQLVVTVLEARGLQPRRGVVVALRCALRWLGGWVAGCWGAAAAGRTGLWSRHGCHTITCFLALFYHASPCRPRHFICFPPVLQCQRAAQPGGDP
jgi:hypothetical protein